MGSISGGHASLLGRSLGNYAVKALIGRGAMGTVYLARDKALGRKVALKVLLGSLARNPEQVKSFLLEARAAAPLQHPNIVGIYEAGVREGTPFIAMEFVEGEPLDRFLRRHGRVPSWQNALNITYQLAEGLSCAHRAGIVHRDVKPANILLDVTGRVRLSDFGIANIHQDGEACSLAAHYVGTPEYMSPEQCAGLKVLSPASDLFSLGVTLYQMISGRLPFQGATTVSLMNNIVTATPPRLNVLDPEVPDDVARLAALLMEKTAQERPGSAQELCGLIQRIQRDKGGASALPQALNTFIQEASEPRCMEVATPTPEEEVVEKGAFQLKPGSPWRRFTRIAAAVLFLMTLTGLGYWRYLRPVWLPGPAQNLSAAVDWEDWGEVRCMRLPDKAWQVDQLRWLGGRPVVIVAVEGARNSVAAGARGFISVSVSDQQVYSMMAPRYQQKIASLSFLPALHASPNYSPFFDAAPFVSLNTLGEEGVVAFQRWNENRAREEVFSLPGNDGARILAAIPSPDPFTLLLLLEEADGAGVYLASRDTRWRDSSRLGKRLTRTGPDILPESITFSPNGKSVLYTRESDQGERHLWRQGLDSPRGNGDLLFAGAIEGPIACDPSGPHLALTLCGYGEKRVLVISSDTGNLVQDLGPGSLGHSAWHPSGNYLLALAPEQGGSAAQLWALETAAPNRRHCLTRLADGLARPASLSQDGQWAAGVAYSGEEELLVFIDLSLPGFDLLSAGKAAKRMVEETLSS